MVDASDKLKIPSARQLVRQDGGVAAPRAGRGRPGWPMAAHQLASAYQKFKEAEETLPEELKPVFRRFVDEYEYLTSVHYGRGYVAYKVLADLDLAGWRPSTERVAGSKL